jgi:hypothetical protein
MSITQHNSIRKCGPWNLYICLTLTSKVVTGHKYKYDHLHPCLIICQGLYLIILLLKIDCYLYFLTGETDDASIRALRSRQMKNFHLALMISQVHN